MPPGWCVTAAAKMPKSAGYSALDDRRTARIARVRTRASGNVLFTQFLDLAINIGEKKIFRLTRDVTLHDFRNLQTRSLKLSGVATFSYLKMQHLFIGQDNRQTTLVTQENDFRVSTLGKLVSHFYRLPFE